VAAAAGMTLQHVACGGAKADEGLYGPQTVGQAKLTPQLDEAFAAGTPDLMSITIGANDVRWAQFIRQCYAWKCGKSWDDIRVQAYLLDLRWELYRTMAQIETRSDGQAPPVILTGYFDPIQGKTCAALPNITAAEAAWLSAQVTLLNQAISETASNFEDFVTYVPVDFSGHGLCDAVPWVQGMADAAPVHPTAAGQQAIAGAVQSALHGKLSAETIYAQQ
jgi:lysophospholipase L1-like esterase